MAIVLSMCANRADSFHMVENAMPGNWMKNTHNLLQHHHQPLRVFVCVCGYKLYSVYFVSVCWFDILARIQTELLSFIHFLTLWLSSILFASSPLAVQFSYHATNRAKQRFVEIHLNEFRMWNDCYFSTSIIYYNVHVSGGENGSALPISSWNIPNAKQPNYI